MYLEDPLIELYITQTYEKRFLRFFKKEYETNVSKLVRRYNAVVTEKKLEELPFQSGTIDLLVCINVLDHVFDFHRCMDQMCRVLKRGGILIIGQDLSNEEDKSLCPESWDDIGHPIKLDENTIADKLRLFKPLMFKILSREEGRNPAAHYGTYLFIGEKAEK